MTSSTEEKSQTLGIIQIIAPFDSSVAGEGSVRSDWLERMLGGSTQAVLDEVAEQARITPPAKLPPSTPTTLIYRYISEFLTHLIGRQEKWECRNGFADSSGYGGGVRGELFEQFPTVQREETQSRNTAVFGEPAYHFWFLIKDGDPVICLHTGGQVFLKSGERHDLAKLYENEKRIWPMLHKTASDFLP
ncbi:hypothetical protein P0Y35_09605 [Kiritimatiellaeota bacterium B1221]|nr:hypothetical protein [Kiritimatiellaeota bacterium B1221]